MAKYVKYNGGKDSYYGCSDPKVLSTNIVYEVVHEDDRGWQTNYTLKGVEGYFNSVWFSEVPVYLAVAKEKPELLKQFKCCKICADDKTISYQPVTTSSVKKMIQISSKVYQIFTSNSSYIVQVI